MWFSVNEYHNALAKTLESAQIFSDPGLILLLVDKRKLCRDIRADTNIPANIMPGDSKKQKQKANNGFKVSLCIIILGHSHCR